MGDKSGWGANRWPTFEVTAADPKAMHRHMCRLTTWFVKHIAYSCAGSALAIDHHQAIASRRLDDILADLFDTNHGATCAGLSLFMATSAKRAGYDAVEVNFGDNGFESHVLVLVALGDNERVFYDPTFGCFSGKVDGTPASVRVIIDFLRQDKGDELRWVSLGLRERAYLFHANERPELPLASPIRQLDERRSLAMIDVNFHACMTWNAIWQWARSQRPGVLTIFDCLRFPQSTSGEVQAEALAKTLRNIC